MTINVTKRKVLCCTYVVLEEKQKAFQFLERPAITNVVPPGLEPGTT